MEKRRESRYTIGQPVTVTILSGNPSTYQATVKNGSGNGMALEMPAPVPPGAAIEITMGDNLLLGEAVHCSSQGGGFLVGVMLDSKLSQLSRLAQMLEKFAEGEAPVWHPSWPGGSPRDSRWQAELPGRGA